MLLEWQAGMPILGFESNPVPWAYVVGDRLLIEAHDTCRAMGIDPTRIPMIGGFGDQNKSARAIMNEAEKMGVGLLVWEGFSDFCEGDRKKEVREFMSNMAAYCHRKEFFNSSLTFLGVMESPKLKPSEMYPDPRHRISGVAGWGYHASSVWLIESTDPHDIENPNRKLKCSIKNGPSVEAEGSFNDRGQLTFQKVLAPKATGKHRFDVQ